MAGRSTHTLTYNTLEVLDGKVTAVTGVYQKPMNRYMYIVPFSYHRPSTLAHWPTSEHARYIKLSTREDDCMAITDQFKTRLATRGYCPLQTARALSVHTHADRTKLLAPARRTGSESINIVLRLSPHAEAAGQAIRRRVAEAVKAVSRDGRVPRVPSVRLAWSLPPPMTQLPAPRGVL